MKNLGLWEVNIYIGIGTVIAIVFLLNVSRICQWLNSIFMENKEPKDLANE